MEEIMKKIKDLGYLWDLCGINMHLHAFSGGTDGFSGFVTSKVKTQL
jgi:hypothetical protein